MTKERGGKLQIEDLIAKGYETGGKPFLNFQGGMGAVAEWLRLCWSLVFYFLALEFPEGLYQHHIQEKIQRNESSAVQL